MHVAVGIVRNAVGEILIAQRPLSKYKGGLWEFPGGKVEQNESSFEALQRELKEEVGIDVIAAENWFQFEYDYTDRVVLLDIWRITQFTGEPHGREGQSVKWILPSQFDQFQFPDGNKIIIEKIIEA